MQACTHIRTHVHTHGRMHADTHSCTHTRTHVHTAGAREDTHSKLLHNLEVQAALPVALTFTVTCLCPGAAHSLSTPRLDLAWWDEPKHSSCRGKERTKCTYVHVRGVHDNKSLICNRTDTAVMRGHTRSDVVLKGELIQYLCVKRVQLTADLIERS